MPFFKRLFSKKIIFGLLFSGGFFIILSSSAFAAELNETDSFFVDPVYDWQSREQITATVKAISEHAYFYIEDDYWNALTTLQRKLYLDYLESAAENFDEITYPDVRGLFGSEWKPGIDDDNKITILLTYLKSGAGGYFNGKDEFSTSYYPTSNEREMFYVNSTLIANELFDSFLAHEFQHLINWNQKEKEKGLIEEVWLNELRSEYAPTVAGYDDDYVGSNLERRVDDYLANPFDSLTEWAGDKYDYPSVNVFGHYLADQFGEDIFTYMMENGLTGVSSIQQAIKDMGHNLTFSQVFNNWTIANYLNDSDLYDGRYGYSDDYLKNAIHVSPITYSIVSTSVINTNQNIKDWAPYWYRFINKQNSAAIAKDLEIEFAGSKTRGNFSVIYIVEYKNGSIAIGSVELSNQEGVLKIPDFKTDVDSATIIVSNQFKRSGFDESEPSVPFSLSVATTIFDEDVEPLIPEEPYDGVRPEDFGLKEGDLIRAQGDFDIFIINQYGYKRLFLNPEIFEMYGHLGSWEDVITVTPDVRDAFITSSYYRFFNDEKVYHMEVTGGDTGILHWLDMSADDFYAQDGKAEAIFTINEDEFNWYPKGEDMTSL